MFGKIFKILGGIASVIPVVKDIWYAVKKDVPRVTCPVCKGSGQIVNADPANTTPLSTCPKCKGSGKVRSTEL